MKSKLLTYRESPFRYYEVGIRKSMDSESVGPGYLTAVLRDPGMLFNLLSLDFPTNKMVIMILI